ncbi:glycerophosphoryl diester phosphodiesterase membrane domain-containing protein [Streptomyces roseoverticillatus]|uniref:glycerophosphoryl diester phosphodiesterase membrane domain-containing protein n=1 Tax=Streptomyces roseoverticillatus TaxID=66429 RepID=UPI0005B93AEF|nr:glycerophosphoryl diester phosphodiesterase membrane domain-containing protein [Streptomyces roseoverticillatus]
MTDSPGRTSPGSSPSEETDKAAEAAEAAQEGRPAQWAQEQPPPGDWSTSAQGPPRQRRGTGERARAQTGPGPGHGGAGGVPGQPGPQAGRQQPGRPQWGRPQAPQPGVIPLRPLQAGEIVEGAVRTMRIHWRAVLGISLTVAVGTQVVATMVDRLWDQGTPELDPLGGATPETPQELVGAIGNGLGGIGVAWLLSLIGSITAAALLTVIVSRAVLGRPVTAREAWRSARPQLGRMAGLMVLVPMLLIGVFAAGIVWGLLVAAAGAEQAGMSLTALGGLAAMVVATWLWIRYSLAAPALMLEKQGVAAAMQRSAKLVRGSWWRVFGIQLISILITALVGLMAQAIVLVFDVFIHGGGGQSVADATDWASLIEVGIAAVVSSALTLPVSAGMTALLYMDQRIRRESLDVELARSASEGK